MAITVDPNVGSAPLPLDLSPTIDLNLVPEMPRDVEGDEAKAARKGEEKKLAQAEEQRLATQDRPPPKPAASKPTRPAEVVKPAEPVRQPEVSKNQDPQAVRAREAEQKAGQQLLQDKAAAFRAIEQPKTAAAPATPAAPPQVTGSAGAEIKKDGDGKEGDPKEAVDAKTDSGKSLLTKADAKTAGTEAGGKSVVQGGGEQVAGEVAESKLSTPPSTDGKLQADTPHDFGKLLSGRPRPNVNTTQAASARPSLADQGDPKEKAVLLAKGPLPVMATVSTSHVRKPGLLTRMAQLLNKTLGGGSAPLPKPVATAPALATTATPSAEVAEKTPAKAPKGDVKVFLATTGMGSEEKVAAYVQHLASALNFGRDIMGGGRPLPFGVPTAMVNGGKRAFDKSSPKFEAKDQEVAETRGDSSDLGRACKTGRFRGQIGNYA